MEEEMKIAYAEIFEILRYMPKQQVMKVPMELLQIFKENRKKDYISKIDKNDIYNKTNISSKALSILAYLNLNYWVDEEKKAKLIQLYRKNDLEKMSEQELQYPTSVFKDKKNKHILQNESKKLIVKKMCLFQKILMKIKNIWSK